MKSGVRLRLANPKLGKGLEYLENRGHAFRRQLEAVVDLPTSDALAVHQSLTIDAVVCHEMRRQLLMRWLRLHAGELKIPERVALLDSVGKAVDARNRALKELKLDRDRKQDVIDLLYRQPLQDDAGRDPNRRPTSESDTGTNAAETTQGDES